MVYSNYGKESIMILKSMRICWVIKAEPKTLEQALDLSIQKAYNYAYCTESALINAWWKYRQDKAHVDFQEDGLCEFFSDQLDKGVGCQPFCPVAMRDRGCDPDDSLYWPAYHALSKYLLSRGRKQIDFDSMQKEWRKIGRMLRRVSK